MDGREVQLRFRSGNGLSSVPRDAVPAVPLARRPELFSRPDWLFEGYMGRMPPGLRLDCTKGDLKKPPPRQRTALSLDIATKSQVAIDTL